jgi:hypothetical protein
MELKYGNKGISVSELESMIKDSRFNTPGIMESMIDDAMKGFLEKKNNIIAFLVLSRAVFDDISPRQVLLRYEIEEVPIKDPFVMDFRDMANRQLKFEIESQLKLVPRKRKFRLTKDKWLDCKVSLLEIIDKVFNAKQVKDETNSSKQQ